MGNTNKSKKDQIIYGWLAKGWNIKCGDCRDFMNRKFKREHKMQFLKQ